jgi:hypothetical protein
MGQDPRLSSEEARKQTINYNDALNLIRRGEKHLNSSHLLEFSLKDSVVNGKVKASMRPEIWIVKVRPLIRKHCVCAVLLT